MISRERLRYPCGALSLTPQPSVLLLMQLPTLRRVCLAQRWSTSIVGSWFEHMYAK